MILLSKGSNVATLKHDINMIVPYFWMMQNELDSFIEFKRTTIWQEKKEILEFLSILFNIVFSTVVI